MYKDASKGGKEENTTFQMCCVTYRYHLALGGHEGRAVAQAELGMQGVESWSPAGTSPERVEACGRAVVAEILPALLHGAHGLLRHAVLQPRDGATDPLQQLQRDGAVRDGEMEQLETERWSS